MSLIFYTLSTVGAWSIQTACLFSEFDNKLKQKPFKCALNIKICSLRASFLSCLSETVRACGEVGKIGVEKWQSQMCLHCEVWAQHFLFVKPDLNTFGSVINRNIYRISHLSTLLPGVPFFHFSMVSLSNQTLPASPNPNWGRTLKSSWDS